MARILEHRYSTGSFSKSCEFSNSLVVRKCLLAECSKDVLFPVIILTRSARIRIFGQFQITISCVGLDWQVSSIAQVCGHLSTLLSQVERLDMRAKPLDPPQRVNDDMDPNRSLERSDFTGSWLDSIDAPDLRD